MSNKLLSGAITLILAFLVIGCNSITLPPSGSDTKKDSKKEDKKDGDEKDFAEIIKDCQPITGMLTIYQHPKNGNAYLELKPEQLDKIMLCSVTRESGDGTFLDAASMEDSFPFFFRIVNKRVQLIYKNVLVRADRDKPVFRAVEKGTSDSLISSSIVLSKPHSTTGAVLVSLNDLFLFDRYSIARHLSEATKADFSFDKENSWFSILKSFPANTDIEINMHFRAGKEFYSATVPDKSLFIRYYYSISTLPQDNYVPRLADDRVGHFITVYQDYSSMKPETPYVRYINRWNLEKSDPNAALSAPKKPIVFWLEKTVPTEYREPIKKGILLWNKAFEQAGFKDALVVYQQPDDADWDPADVRYNTIRWLIRPGSGYAVGPSHEDPFTGQLYAADIRISADMARINYTEFEESINPLGVNNNASYCNYANGLLYQAAFASSMLTARAFLDGKEKEAEQFVADYLTDLAVHEVGHTLGLRHNFKSSIMLTADQLNDKSLTSTKGMTGSVMDYTPANISVDPAKQGEFWQSTVGPYDCWAIEYAYKPFGAKSPDEELPPLKAIAARCAQPELAYGTDEDCHGNSPTGIDPTCTLWDLGNDQLEYVNQRIKLAQELWGRIENKFSKPGESYQKMRRVFNQGVKEYAIGATLVARFIGGIYYRRDHIADPDGRLPFEPVSAKKQKQALDFLINNVFSLSEKSIPVEVLNKLGTERLPGTDHGNTLDVQIYNSILSIQQSVLNYMYHPAVLRRLDNMALKYKKDEPIFGMSELFNGIREGIWTEAAKGENITQCRRNLQRVHMERLISIFLSDSRSYPSDAIALARNDLKLIKDYCAVAEGNDNLDDISQAHLEDIKARITTALEWKVSKPY